MSASKGDPGGKFTLFALISLIAPAGVCAGASAWGYALLDWPGATALGLVGFIVGLLIGGIPKRIALKSVKRRLNRCDTEALKERLTSQCYMSHLIVPVLQSRGEPQTELQDCILSLLLAQSREVRWSGWRTIHLCFPQLSERLQGIDVTDPPQAYEHLVRHLRAELGHVPSQ